MKSPLHLSMVGILALTSLAGNAAQTNTPDCVGIRPGMSVTEARQRMERYAPELKVQAVEFPIPGLGEKPVLDSLFIKRIPPGVTIDGPTEVLQAGITLPPSRPTVWKVIRSLRFEPGREQTKTALIEALRKKYGHESLAGDEPAGKFTLCWVIGADGKFLEGEAARQCCTFCRRAFKPNLDPGADPAFASKLRSITGPTTVLSARSKVQDSQQCQSVTYVMAELSVISNPELVDKMVVAVIDAALDRKATEATQAAIKKAEAAKTREELKKADQQEVPKL